MEFRTKEDSLTEKPVTKVLDNSLPKTRVLYEKIAELELLQTWAARMGYKEVTYHCQMARNYLTQELE
jgi:hypothetical protein